VECQILEEVMSDPRIQTLIQIVSWFEESQRQNVPSRTIASPRWTERAQDLARELGFGHEEARRVFGEYVASPLQDAGLSAKGPKFEEKDIAEAVSAVDAMRQRMNEEWLDSFGLLSLPIAEMNPDKTKIIGRIVQDAILNLMHNIPVSSRYREAHTPLYSA
jgi:hypothetical protein